MEGPQDTVSASETILVTGVNGFIGAAVARRLVGAGHRVLGSDLGPEPSVEDLAGYLSVDLGAPQAWTLLDWAGNVDRVLHAGGVSGFMVETDNPRRIVEVNVGGSLAVLELARQRRARRTVLCSTIMAYGPGDGDPVEEHEYPTPVSVYGASKVALEGLVYGYAGQHGVDGVALRFSHVYGPGRTTQCFIREMLHAARSDTRCTLAQPASSPRQYVYIEDVCDSIELALFIERLPTRHYNITADEFHTLAEVRVAVESVVGPLAVDFDESNDILAYRMPKLSIRRARAELGYAPRFDLRHGIAAYAQALTATG